MKSCQTILPQNPKFALILNHATWIVTWNVVSLSTILSNIQHIITSTSRALTIMTLQKTKISATNSIWYKTNLSTIQTHFNDTHANTCIKKNKNKIIFSNTWWTIHTHILEIFLKSLYKYKCSYTIKYFT